MMKRSTKRALRAAGIFLLAVLLVWGVIYRFRIPEIKGVTLLTYVPAELDSATPLGAVAGLRNPRDAYRKLKETEFYGALDESFKIQEEKIILNTMGRETAVALYGNPQEEVYYLMLGEIRDIGGFKQMVYERIRDPEDRVKEYRGEGIEKYSEDVFYSVAGGVFMAANTIELIEKSIDLKKGQGRVENFNIPYPWVEEQMDRNGDAYIFTAGQQVYEVLRNIYPPIMGFLPGAIKDNVYREIYFDSGGFTLHTYTPLPDDGASTGEARSLEAIPPYPVMMQAGAETDFQAGVRFLMDRNIIAPELSGQLEDVARLLGKEASFAVMASPSSQDIIPGVLLFAQGSREAYGPLRELIKESFDISLTEGSTGRVQYHYGRMPLFFTNIEITLAHMDVRDRGFIVLASSRELFERAAAAAGGREESFARSKPWKEIKEHIPARYTSVFYTDIDSLSKSVSPVLNFFGERHRLAKFLRAQPFNWLKPAGGARIIEDDFKKAYMFIPVRDLEKEQWADLFSRASEFLSN